MTPSFTLQTVMEKTDYRRFLLDNAYHIALWPNLLARGATALVAALAVRTLADLKPGTTITLWLALYGALLLVQRLALELQYRLETAEDRLQQFGRPQMLHFREKDILIKAEGISQTGTLAYNQLLRAARTRHAFYLYLTPKTAAILPRQAMTLEEANELTLTLRQKLGTKFKCRDQ